MNPLEILIILVAWIGPSIVIAKYAERRGRDFWSYFGISLLVGWLIGLVVVLLRGRVEPSPPNPAQRIEGPEGAVGR